jgi:hypothetical protein
MEDPNQTRNSKSVDDVNATKQKQTEDQSQISLISEPQNQNVSIKTKSNTKIQPKSTHGKGRGRKIGLVLWKNYILHKRHWFLTSIEIVLPIFIVFCIAAPGFKSSKNDSGKNSGHGGVSL